MFLNSEFVSPLCYTLYALFLQFSYSVFFATFGSPSLSFMYVLFFDLLCSLHLHRTCHNLLFSFISVNLELFSHCITCRHVHVSLYFWHKHTPGQPCHVATVLLLPWSSVTVFALIALMGSI